MLTRKRVSLIIKNLGKIENIKSIGHQDENIDFYIKDSEIIDLENLQIIDQVHAAYYKDEVEGILTLKIVEVDLRDALIEEVDDKLELTEKDNKENTIINKIFDFLSQIFQPVVPAFAGAGILKGLLLLFNQLGLLSTNNGVYILLTIASNGIFYFLPVMLAITTSRVLKVNPFIGVLVAFSLIHPDFIELFNTGVNLDFLGIPVVLIDYSSTVIPIVLAIFMYALLYNFLQKRLSDTLKTIFIPLLTLAIIVPLTVLVAGPIGYYSGEFLAGIVTWLMNANGMLTGLVMGGSWLLIIATGLNWAINPIMLNNLSVYGYDYIRPFTFASNFATLGIVIGIFLATKKNRELKNYAGANIFTLAISGMVEPTLFGILVKYRKYFIAQIIGGAVGAAYMGFMSVTANTFVFGSLITLTALVGDEPSNIINGLIGLVIAMVTAAVIAFVITKSEERKITVA
jgi:PTS system beta-glucosides-specific IIC component